MSIKEMMLKSKGLWLITAFDKSLWVIDLDTNRFDSYGWYLTYGVLENEFDSLDTILKNAKGVRRLENANKSKY